MADLYQRGDTAKIDVEIRNADGALVDPGLLTFTVVTPAGVSTPYVYPDPVVVRRSLGAYRAVLPLGAVGTWRYDYLSVNPGQVGGGSLLVGPRPTDPPVVTVIPLAPTASDVRAWAPPAFDWAAYGFPEGAAPDPLEVRVQMAVGQLYAVTGRTLASIILAEEAAVARKVLAAFVVMEATGGGSAALTAMAQPWLKSFSAGSYSEMRFSPAELGAAGSKSPPFPGWLWWMLYALMTPEKRDEWRRLLGGQVAPAVANVAVSFDGAPSWDGRAWGSGGESFEGW